MRYFLIGIGLGAAVMLLFAPDKGKNTRRNIRRRVDEGQEFLENSASKVQEMGEDLIEKSRGTLKRANSALASVF